MADSRDELVKKRAYEIWEAEGRPWGRDAEHWQQAFEEIFNDSAISPPLHVADSSSVTFIEQPTVTEIAQPAGKPTAVKPPAKSRTRKPPQ